MKKIKLTTDVKVLKTNVIDTLEFRLVYPIKHHNDNGTYIRLLNLFISTTSAKFPSNSEFYTEKLKKTVLGLNIRELTILDNSYIIFSFTTPRVGLLKDFNLEKTFKFAIDTLLNPYAENGEFNKEKLASEIEYTYNNYKRSKDSIYSSNSNQFYDYIDPEELLGNSYAKAGEVIKGVTPKKLYDFYKKNILENTFIPYVYGNISLTDAKKLFKKYIPQDKKEVSFNVNHFKPMPMKTHTYQEIKTPFNQSELCLEFQVDMKKTEVKYLSTLVNILNGAENNLIFEALRVKNNLVYDVQMSTFSSRAMFIIIAFIPSNKYKETKKIIKSVFTKLKDKEFLTICLNKLIKGLEVDLLREEDSQGKLLNDTINNDLDILTTEELLERTKSVKVDDLIKFIDRIKITNEMFFRGEENDKA